MSRISCFFCLLLFVHANAVSANMVTTNKPYSYERLEQDLFKIKNKYGQHVKIKSIGTSHFGRNIWAVKLGDGEKNIVLIGSHHGREWLTSTLLMKMLETYSEAYHETERVGTISTKILNEISIWFVPMVNPDGVTIQQNQLSLFPSPYQKQLIRMNKGSNQFERWKANGLGVDLNRQYPAGWEKLKQEPSAPFYQFYKGKQPLEAKEIIALTDFINEIKPTIAVAYHSAGREIFWNYKNGKFKQRDYKIAKKISKLTHYRLGKPNKEAIGGGFTDWFISKYHRPAMTIEISYLVGETNPPLSVFKNEWKRNRYVGLKLAKEAKKIH